MEETEILENPTLALKLSAILCQPWNRELLAESVSVEAILRLKGTPLTSIEADPRERGARWSEDYREETIADVNSPA